MAQIHVNHKNPLHAALAKVAPGTAIQKQPAVAAPGELSVPSTKQTVTSLGTTPAQNVSIAKAAAASNPATSAPTPAAVATQGLSGAVNFGSASGSLSGNWLMLGGVLLVAYLVFRKA